MKILLCRIFIVLTLTLAGCQSAYLTENNKADTFKLIKLFPTASRPSVKFDTSIRASSVVDTSHAKPRIIVPVSNGEISALDSETGALLWQHQVPTPPGQQTELIASPIVIDDKLVLVYQCLEKGVRRSHHLAVFDLAHEQFDESFPTLTFSAEQPTADGKAMVKFNPATAYSHAALKQINRPNAKLGYVYVAFGNASDVQPFHGWVFEIDMDAWQQQGVNKAVRNVLLTTPEADCPAKMEYGTQEMICGGGVWVPAGPLIVQEGDKADLFIPTGNGQVDIARHDYANSIMRVKPGLKFEAGCDAKLCQKFNPKNPDLACLLSCKNLFIPRLAEGNAEIKPPYHECDDKDFWECLAWMDYDLGGSQPIKITLSNGQSVLIQPGKDGGAYLLDAEHLGHQYDRLQIAKLCGSPTDLCKLSWAGMIVTQPVQTVVDDTPVVIIPTFSADQTNAAGLVALKIVLKNGEPKFETFWRFPAPSDTNALKMFRSHPSFPVLTTHLGTQHEAIIWIVDIGTQGTLYGIRAKDGALVAKQTLEGAGRQLSMPLIIGDRIYLASILPNTGKALLEAYRIELDRSSCN